MPGVALTGRSGGVTDALREYRIVALVALVALALRLLWRAHFLSGPGLDGAGYVDLATSLTDGSGYAALNGQREGFIAPLFPALIALVSLVRLDAVSTVAGAGRAISVLFGALLVLPVYLLAGRLVGKRVAAVAACAVAMHPVLVHLSAIALPESTCLALVTTAFYWQFRALRSNQFHAAALAGIFHGLAILTRPEAVVTLLSAVAAYGIVHGTSRDAARRIAMALAGSVAVVAAGVAFVLYNHGRIEPSSLFFPMVGVLPTVGFLRTLHVLSLPLLLVLSIVGLFRRKNDTDLDRLPVLVAVIASALTLGWAAGPAGLVAGALPILLIWASKGAIDIVRAAAAAVRSSDGVPKRRLAYDVIAAVAIGATFVMPYRALTDGGQTTRLLWDIGWWLSSLDPHQKSVMDSSPAAALHAGGGYVPFPSTDSRSALQAIDDAAVDYVVVQRADAATRPYLQEWVERGIPDRRAQLLLPEWFSGVPVTRAGFPDVFVYKWARDRRDEGQDDVSGADSRESVTPGTPATPSRLNGPLTVSTANPRYFTDSRGNAIYLTGFHTWTTLQDMGRVEPLAHFDFDAYLSDLQAHGVNFVRLWMYEEANWFPSKPYDYRFAPLPFPRNGPGHALDGRLKFDVSQFDDNYFRRLRDRVTAAGARGIYVSVMLFQGWSVGRDGFREYKWGDPWAGHPFNRANNVNGVDGDPEMTGEGWGVHTGQDRSVQAIQERYVEKVVDTVNDLDNVLYEICNECPGESFEWQAEIVRLIHRIESGRPKQHPVGMTAMPGRARNNRDLANSPADWISPDAEGGYLTNPPAADGSKVIVADTDHLWGVGGDHRWVWRSFLRGLNPIFMDAYDRAVAYAPGGDARAPQWETLRRNLGHTARYAARIGLASMFPRADLCSSTFCLARPDGPSPGYLAFFSAGERVTLDLTRSAGELEVEWFEPVRGVRLAGGKVIGGAVTEFAPPFSGDIVLYVSRTNGTS